MNIHFQKFTSLARTMLCAAALMLGAGGIAAAQPAPSTDQAAVPSYSTPAHDQQIRGHISAITGKYSLQVRDQRGYIDNIALHQGTIINPTGLTLQPGMQVTISGTNAGNAFAANEIDTPYTVAIVQPAYPVYGAGWGWGPAWGFGGPPPFGWSPGFGYWR